MTMIDFVGANYLIVSALILILMLFSLSINLMMCNIRWNCKMIVHKYKISKVRKNRVETICGTLSMYSMAPTITTLELNNKFDNTDKTLQCPKCIELSKKEK